MTELIVLGTIPGTNIQIGFTFWIVVSMAFGCMLGLALLRRYRHELSRWLAAYVVAYSLNRSTKQLHQLA